MSTDTERERAIRDRWAVYHLPGSASADVQIDIRYLLDTIEKLRQQVDTLEEKCADQIELNAMAKRAVFELKGIDIAALREENQRLREQITLCSGSCRLPEDCLQQQGVEEP